MRGAVLDLAFDTDGRRLATAQRRRHRPALELPTGVQLLVLRLAGLATSVAFSPDGSMLATAGAGGVVRVWALELDDLIAIAEDKVSRALSGDECRRYPSIDRCSLGQDD